MMHTAPCVRGHHLLCLLTYVGRGYSPDFVRAMDGLARHIAGGGLVQLCVGPDVLCATLEDAQSDCQAHCRLARNAERDHVALREVSAVLKRQLRAGACTMLTPRDIQTLRRALQPLDARASSSGLRAACGGCEWLTLCRQVTATQFAEATMSPAPQARLAASNQSRTQVAPPAPQNPF